MMHCTIARLFLVSAHLTPLSPLDSSCILSVCVCGWGVWWCMSVRVFACMCVCARVWVHFGHLGFRCRFTAILYVLHVLRHVCAWHVMKKHTTSFTSCASHTIQPSHISSILHSTNLYNTASTRICIISMILSSSASVVLGLWLRQATNVIPKKPLDTKPCLRISSTFFLTVST